MWASLKQAYGPHRERMSHIGNIAAEGSTEDQSRMC